MLVSSTKSEFCSLSMNIGLTASMGEGILSSLGPVISGWKASVTGAAGAGKKSVIFYNQFLLES